MGTRINALSVNGTTITIPKGATGGFYAELKTDRTLDMTKDVFVFSVSNSELKKNYAHGREILTKWQYVSVRDGVYYAYFDFANADTRGIMAGIYAWDITLVTDADFDAKGNPICKENSDNVYPIYASQGLNPIFIIKEVSYIV